VDIQLAQERIFTFDDQLSADELERRATERRVQAFGGGIGSLLQRPKAEDIDLVARQRRLAPFWHVACAARYVYERNRDYAVPASAPEVTRVTINGTTYDVADARQPRSFTLTVREHCRDEFRRETFADASTGGPVADGAIAVANPRTDVPDPSALATDETVVVPVEHRASFVVRKLVTEMMKPLHADTVLEESLTLELTDLYYRPIWAFEFLWRPRDRKGVVEIDALTGETRQGQALLPQLRGMMTRDVLFDIGADTAGLLVPGGSIAVRVVKAAMEKNR
jgi:hypothetical protein